MFSSLQRFTITFLTFDRHRSNLHFPFSQTGQLLPLNENNNHTRHNLRTTTDIYSPLHKCRYNGHKQTQCTQNTYWSQIWTRKRSLCYPLYSVHLLHPKQYCTYQLTHLVKSKYNINADHTKHST